MEIENESQNTKLMIENLLKSQGIEEYDNSSINCLNEFINSYITDIIKEAKTRAKLSKKDKIDKVSIGSILKAKQNNMYQSKSNVLELTYFANRINSYELPPIPELPVVLKPPVMNNLLRNNFQIYSDELNKTLTEKNNKIKEKEMNILGNKRTAKDINDNKNIKKEIKNKRKKSVSQENKTSNKKNKSLENKNISNSKNNDSDIISNSLNNNEDNYESDISDSSIGENNRESTINKKEDEDDSNDSKEESEGDNDGNNESNDN